MGETKIDWRTDAVDRYVLYIIRVQTILQTYPTRDQNTIRSANHLNPHLPTCVVLDDVADQQHSVSPDHNPHGPSPSPSPAHPVVTTTSIITTSERDATSPTSP
jgi:hypothetical protein